MSEAQKCLTMLILAVGFFGSIYLIAWMGAPANRQASQRQVPEVLRQGRALPVP